VIRMSLGWWHRYWVFKSLGGVDVDSDEYEHYLEDMWQYLSVVHSPFSSIVDQLIEMIKYEIIQMDEEGYDVSDARESFEKLLEKSVDVDQLVKFYSSLKDSSKKYGYPYIEPIEYKDIVSESGEEGIYGIKLSDEELYDKVYGGWLGRCAGCMLGKPVEGFTPRLIRTWLSVAGEDFLNDYFPDIKLEDIPKDRKLLLRRVEDIHRWFIERGRGILRNQISCVVRDDDIDYTILNLHIVKTHGLNFTTLDIANTWLHMIPYCQVYTAERIAYRNLVNGILPPRTATYMNPFREWIGAQIRADLWGYISPGLPRIAAEYAYRDASLSHVKNGIYGEMFIAAMISSAFILEDIYDVVEAGLSVIPKRSRLAEAIRDVVNWSRESRDYWETYRKIIGKYGLYNPVHTIINAAIVTASLLHGYPDYGKAIALAVISGFDTDCNGATVGSIMGVMLGAKKLYKDWGRWVEPLHDTVESYVIGYNGVKISDLAKQTTYIAKNNIELHKDQQNTY